MVRFLVLYDVPANIDAFERHYHEIHIPLARKLPGLVRYTLGRNISPVRGGDPYYLVAELDWKNMDDLKRAFSSPEGKATANDLSKFASSGVRSMIYETVDV